MSEDRKERIDREKGTRGWVIVLLVAVLGLGFYLGGRQAVDELSASGQITTTPPTAEADR